MRCLSSQTRSAARRRVLVRARVPAAGGSEVFTEAVRERGFPFRVLVRLLRVVLTADSLTGKCPLLFILRDLSSFQASLCLEELGFENRL